MPTGDPDGAPTESTASRSPGFTSSPGPAGEAVEVVEPVELVELVEPVDLADAPEPVPDAVLEPEASASTASEPIGGVGGISVDFPEVPVDVVPAVVAASLRVVFSSLMLVAPSVAARPLRSRASRSPRQSDPERRERRGR
ncbi:hypothetical protein GCM10010932_13640 [Agromyces flavus]|nr:hypothetical protein GCM10010932_13640 [Agromyces flavus]